jgi:Holin of 3TMs, for gene-transfer release
MASPIEDDDDEPTGPRRVMDDERPPELQLKSSAPSVAIAAINSDNTIELRKLALEEMRFHLEERKELHKMEIEMRKLEQEERDKEREQTRKDKELEQKESKQNEHWVQKFWRPAMGWLYMGICFMDFIGFPMLTIFLPILFKPFGLTMPYTAWKSLTLDNGGLIHIAFGAILGVSAFTRGQDKAAAGRSVTN